MAKTVQMPNGWNPYPHQRRMWKYMNAGRDKFGNLPPGKRAVCVDHRRSGKDSSALNFTATESVRVKGVYYHMLPTLAQAKRVIWNGIDRNSRRIIDQAFPKEIVKTVNKQDYLIETKTGSMWQLGGSDNYDAFMGTNIKGVVFSEWSLCNPRAWDYIRPILRENGGWAIFIYTPRGRNHGLSLFEMAKNNPGWYACMNTVNETVMHNGKPILTAQDIDEERASGMTDEMIQQEFYCSFEAEMPGAYFANDLAKARDEGRICTIEIDPLIPVHTFWDIGISKGNAMCVWMVQAKQREIRLINFIEKEDSDIPWFVNEIREFTKKHRCYLGEHFAPHDIDVRDIITKKTRRQVVSETLGFNFRAVPKIGDKNEAIQAAHSIFPRCWFDKNRCRNGISGLSSYRRQEDKMNPGRFLDKPVHDWASNTADSYMTLAQGWQDRLAIIGAERPQAVQMDYAGFNLFA